MKTPAFLKALLAGSVLLVGGLSHAQDWSELSARQQQQLQDFQGIWSELDQNRKRELINSASQISRMSPANRQRLVDSMRRSSEDSLTPR